jgi:GNAT superfamily N-acetyltransferase
VTDATWAAALAPDQPLIGRAACADDGALIGFSLTVVHASTWQLKRSGYVEDLFVDPSRRGVGGGRALLDDLLALAEARD